MFQCLAARHALRVVVVQKPCDYLERILVRVRNKFVDSCALLGFEVKYHVSGLLLKLVEDGLLWSAQDVVDFVDLVQLVVSRKDREQRNNFKEDAAYAPVVHFVIVVAVSHQTFRRAVPPRAYVLGKGRLRVHATTGPEIGKLHLVVSDQNVFATI
jgi:hypothetical protein